MSVLSTVRRASKLMAGAVVLSAVTGCASIAEMLDPSYEPEGHSFMGMPSASTSEVEGMFGLPTRWPDGAPSEAKFNGEVTGIWQPVGTNGEGCFEYRLMPVSARHIAPDVSHYWNGRLYQREEEGCVALEAQATDHASDDASDK